VFEVDRALPYFSFMWSFNIAKILVLEIFTIVESSSGQGKVEMDDLSPCQGQK
jgi:hypothetical protein